MLLFRRIGFFLFLALAGATSVRADAPTVTAVLTSSETEVDQPVQLQIKVTGDSNANPPEEIAVDGLDIRYTGQSQLMEGRNLRFTYSFVYNYTILPLKAGTFTIPPQTVQTSSGPLRTPALTLNVAPNDDGSTSTRRGKGSLNLKDIVFCELVIPKTTAYVGETIPAEIRLGFNTRVPSRLVQPAMLSGQGFTSQRLPNAAEQNPDQSMRTVNGRPFEVLTFKTAITPARSGKLEIAAKDAKAIVQVPRRRGSRPRSPFDLFGMDDPFNDPFFNDPFSGVGEQREVTFSSETTTIDVKPLPPNAPPSFSGAVGHFNLTTDVKPKTAQVGDPLTLTATVSGRGNFDRVNAPVLEDDRGWHTYPPGSNFKADDDIGLSGTKTFEMVLTPNEPKKKVPPLLFSYFDPLKEKYVTLKGNKLPVVVEGGAAPSATPAIASATKNPQPPTAQPTAAPREQDILYQLTDHGGWGRSFRPVFQQPVFWAVQGIPFLALVGFFGWEMRRRRLENRAGQRRLAWEQESAELHRKLRRANDPADKYFADALRVVQLKTALAAPGRAVEPNTVDAETAVAAFDLPDEKRARMRELFRQSDELRYSGRGNGNGAVAEETRREVLDLIDSLN
ncbi:MAG TPA: BatD family protein [Chthoniobacterales bacterium]|nr:BatD family protein [Chthoniobacterales bacterium]